MMIDGLAGVRCGRAVTGRAVGGGNKIGYGYKNLPRSLALGFQGLFPPLIVRLAALLLLLLLL
jgi:hypothetical protein